MSFLYKALLILIVAFNSVFAQSINQHAIEYKFKVSINHEALPDGYAKLALNKEGILTLHDEQGQGLFRFRLVASNFQNENPATTSSAVSIRHKIEINSNNQWEKIAEADGFFYIGKEGSIEFTNEKNIHIRMEGTPTTSKISKSELNQLAHSSCDINKSPNTLSKPVFQKTAAGDCCGGMCCNNPKYYSCCGVLACCVCGCCCRTP